MSESGTEIYFYHLERRSLEDVLPTLLERSLERGWRAAVQAASEERVEALNTLLWTYREESFLPHGTARDGSPEAHPIYLTATEDNPNGAPRPFPGRRRRRSAMHRPMLASCSSSTAATPTPWRGRAKTTRRPRALAMQSAIGNRTKAAAGSRRREKRLEMANRQGSGSLGLPCRCRASPL